MGWLASNNWLWLLVAAVLGSLVTLFLTLRKATVVTESVEPVAKGGGGSDGAVPAGVGATGVGAAGVGAAGVGVAAGAVAGGAGAVEPDLEPEPVAEDAVVAEPAAVAEPVALSAGDAGWAPVSAPEAAGWAPAADEDIAPVEPAAGADVPAVAEAPAAEEAPTLSADDAGWAPVSAPEAAGWAPVEDESVAESAGADAAVADAAVADAAVEDPETDEAGYRGSHAAPAGDPLSDPLTAPIDEVTPEVDGEPALFADAAPAAATGGTAVAAGAFGAGSADPLADGASPGAAFVIKGNADSMKFHTEESPYFGRTKAEVWFDSEDSARGAGFRRWDEKAEPVALAAIPDGAYGPGSADPLDNGDAPGAAYTVKGNADSMLFHDTDSPYYSRTKAEVWFDSAETARKAGFAAWNDK